MVCLFAAQNTYELQYNPTILNIMFFFTIIKNCGLVEGELRVALTYSMQMSFDKSLTSLGLTFLIFKIRGWMR